MNSYLFPALERTHEAYSLLCDRIPPEAMDIPTHPGRFTPREVFAHVADWEPILRDERIQAPLNDPGCDIEAYDEGKMAADNGYSETDPAEQIALFGAERAKTIELLKTLTPEQWKIELVHPERGRQTIYDLANTLIGHDMYHIHQLLSVID